MISGARATASGCRGRNTRLFPAARRSALLQDMTRSSRSLLFASALLAGSLSSCATIVGTAVSPLTGGVDLCRESLQPKQWYWMPFVWIGGTIAGPLVAFYNGVNYDPTVFRNFDAYWYGFDEIFRPFHMLAK
jgi:hypothetical protein